MAALTLAQAKKLRVGQTLYQIGQYNADGTAKRWRVSGKVKTWVRSPNRVEFPVKYGLYTNEYITQDHLKMVTLTEPKPRKLTKMSVAEARRKMAKPRTPRPYYPEYGIR